MVVGNERGILREHHQVRLMSNIEMLPIRSLTRGRSWVQSFSNKFRGKLLIDLVATVIDDYDFLWDQYYFPTATL